MYLNINQQNFQSNVSETQSKPKSKALKGAAIGAAITTLGYGGVVRYGYQTFGKELKALKGKSYSEKRKYLEKMNEEYRKIFKKDSFYKVFKAFFKEAKNPVSWILTAGIGGLIGALIGQLPSKKRSKN